MDEAERFVANVNNLTISALDPVAKIPEYKVCAAKILPNAQDEQPNQSGASLP